jgi:hypothetical protein
MFEDEILQLLNIIPLIIAYAKPISLKGYLKMKIGLLIILRL